MHFLSRPTLSTPGTLPLPFPLPAEQRHLQLALKSKLSLGRLSTLDKERSSHYTLLCTVDFSSVALTTMVTYKTACVVFCFMSFPCYTMSLMSVVSTGLLIAPGLMLGSQQGLNKQSSYTAREEQSQDSTLDLSNTRPTSKPQC